MNLLTPEILAQLPALYSQEQEPDPIIYAKFFTPASNWTWYVIEGEPREDGDFLFFGYVQGYELELGYFVLSELESVTGPFGLHIERDLYFEPKRKSQVKEL